MKIASSSLQLESSHSLFQQQEVSESLRMWVGRRRPDFEGSENTANALPVAANPVQISDAGRAAQSAEASSVDAAIEAADKDPMLSLIRKLLALMTGEEVRVFDAGTLRADAPAVAATPASPSQPPQQAGWGVEYDRHTSYTEAEQTSFTASGMVRTADGREIAFDLSLTMARSFHAETDFSLRLGDARRKSDPLVINFSGTAAQLTSQRFAFDLNADGKADERINFVTGGSGFLAFDRNGDGVINDGSELFGTKTGDGFAELARLDSDGNGWIDENDPAYARLSVWVKDASGQDSLLSLKDANVGAISLARAATPFDVKDAANALQAQVRSTGIYLKESGGVGSVQQVDLTV